MSGNPAKEEAAFRRQDKTTILIRDSGLLHETFLSAQEQLILPSFNIHTESMEPYPLIQAERENNRHTHHTHTHHYLCRSTTVLLLIDGLEAVNIIYGGALHCSVPPPQPIISHNWWLRRLRLPPHVDPRSSARETDGLDYRYDWYYQIT